MGTLTKWPIGKYATLLSTVGSQMSCLGEICKQLSAASAVTANSYVKADHDIVCI